MEHVQTLNFRSREAVYSSRKSSLTKRCGLLTLLFQYAKPFIFFDLVVLVLASVLYLAPKLSSSFFGSGFSLYCSSFILLAVLHKGFGARRSRLFAFLYVAVIFFLLGAFVLVILTKLGAIHILGPFQSKLWILWYLRHMLLEWLIFSIAITNFILFPLIHIGVVVWKSFAKMLEKCLPRLFAGAGSLNFRASLVRGGCSLLLLAGCGYTTQIEPNLLYVESIEIFSDKVVEDVTILHLTDMHIEAIGYHERKIFRRIQELDPDIIVHTGDLMDLYNPAEWDKGMMNELADMFRQLSPKYGTYWIVGNHDYGLEKIDWFYKRAGVTLLHDDEHLISGSFGQLGLLGLSWRKSYWDRDKAFIEDWLNAIGKDEFTIVMGHAPDYIPDIVDLNIDLALAGHFHGGQMGIPILQTLAFALALHELGSDFPAQWGAGYRELENVRINVSVGTGTHASTRIFCPPTMTLFTIGAAL